MKCLVVVLASFLVASALGNDYSDCELAEGIDVLTNIKTTFLEQLVNFFSRYTQYLHSVVAEEAGCCGVYYHECGGFDFGAVRQMLDNDAAFWNCLKEYKSVKLKNLKKKIGQIVEDSEGLFPTLAGRSITELEEDRSVVFGEQRATATATATATVACPQNIRCLREFFFISTL